MLSSPCRPDNTIRIFSSAEYRLRVLRRMSRMACSAGSLLLMVFCLMKTTQSISKALTSGRVDGFRHETGRDLTG